MQIPLSWLKEFVNIKMPFPELAEKMSGAGLTIEKWDQRDGDTIFDPEVTPNRIDWLSVTGIAREIAAITGEQFTWKASVFPSTKINDPLKITIKPDYKTVPRIVSVIIRNIKIKPSPEWLQRRIQQIGLRPINNLVDITNFVLWELASPLHVFDYDCISGKTMSVQLSKGGENFRSLDGINYVLPKDTIVISDAERIIDLPPLKGGENTAISSLTKTVLLHSLICNPVLTRHASQKLGLRSDTSAISERGIDPNILPAAVARATELILDLAEGEIASEVMDHKQAAFEPWKVNLSHERLEKMIGIKFSKKEVTDNLSGLELKSSTKGANENINYTITVPTFRPDIKLEEDVIEEVVRVHGMDSLPRTLPSSAVPTNKVAFAKNYDLDYEVKTILKGAGYSEIYTYSLISEKQLTDLNLDPEKALRVDNAISKEYEYLRPTLLGNLLGAVRLNQPNFAKIKIYELGKTYNGATVDNFNETYQLMGLTTGLESFFEAKGMAEQLGKELGINLNIIPPNTKIPEKETVWYHPGRLAEIQIGKETLGTISEIHPSLLEKFAIKGKVSQFSFQYDQLIKLINREKVFQPIPKYPSLFQDLSLVIPEEVTYQNVVEVIKTASPIVKTVTTIDVHENSKTLRISFQDPSKNLTDEEVAKVRTEIEKNLREIKVALKD